MDYIDIWNTQTYGLHKYMDYTNIWNTQIDGLHK